MSLRCLLLLPIFLLTAALPAEAWRCGNREDDVRVPWRELTWDDFRGKPPGRFAAAAAHIQTTVSLDDFELEVVRDGDEFVVSIRRLCLYAVMNRYGSGYKTHARNETTLAHEQGHFDISEIFTRSLREKLSQLRARGASGGDASKAIRKQIQETYQKTLAEWETMERRYDIETSHGTKKSKQRRWYKKIDELLASAD